MPVGTRPPPRAAFSLSAAPPRNRGLAYLVNRAMDTVGLNMEGATVAVQGFGNVGSVAAYSLAKYSAKVVAGSDFLGGIYNPTGLDLQALEAHQQKTGSVTGFAGADPITNEQLLLTPCDVLVPAALERQIPEKNAAALQCNILDEAANGPTTPAADGILRSRPEFFLIPDILCNEGGVIVSYFEWVQDLQSFFWNETEVMDKLFRILETAFGQVLALARRKKITMRAAALSVGIKRVHEAKKMRGLFP